MNTPAKVSVLVIDDEQSVALVCERLFKKQGYDVETVATGAAGLERVRNGSFDVYIIDKNLPDMSGLAVAKAARERSPNGVILMVTGYASVGSAAELVGIADDYVSKPFELEHLRDTVSTLLQQRVSTVRPGPRSVIIAAGQGKQAHVLVEANADEAVLVEALSRLGARVTVGAEWPDQAPEVLVLSGTLADFETRKRVWRWQTAGPVCVVMLVDVASVSDAMAAVALKASFRITRPLDANAHAVLARAMS